MRDWFFTAHGAARTVTIYMPDKNVGSDMISGEFVLESLSYTIDPADPNPVIVSASLLPDGEVTLSTVAT